MSQIDTRPGKRSHIANWKDPPCDFHGTTHLKLPWLQVREVLESFSPFESMGTSESFFALAFRESYEFKIDPSVGEEIH